MPQSRFVALHCSKPTSSVAFLTCTSSVSAASVHVAGLPYSYLYPNSATALSPQQFVSLTIEVPVWSFPFRCVSLPLQVITSETILAALIHTLTWILSGSAIQLLPSLMRFGIMWCMCA